MKKKITRLLLYPIIIITGVMIYVSSFDDLEPACKERSSATKEYFLINYAFTSDFKEIIYKQNAQLKFPQETFRRVYLKHSVLRLPDPIFNEQLDYKENGCTDIDNMDIYCIADFTKLPKGKIRYYYNFMDDNKTVVFAK